MIRSIVLCAGVSFVSLSAEAADRWNESFSTVQQSLQNSNQDKADRIIVYSASWCAPCRKLKPVLHSLTQEGYHVVHHDVDTDRDRLKYRYSQLPTIYFLSKNQVIKKETGYRDKEVIKNSLLPPAVYTPLTVGAMR